MALNIERKVVGMIYLAEINLLVCKQVYDNEILLNNTFLLLSANNAFFEAISIVHTLISSKIKEEIRIKPVLESILSREKSHTPTVPWKTVQMFVRELERDYPNKPKYLEYESLKGFKVNILGNVMLNIRKTWRQKEGLNYLNNLKNKFETSRFHRMRHTAGAHKNLRLDSPDGAAHLLLKTEFIDQLTAIIKSLRVGCYMWFDYEMVNPKRHVMRDLDKLLKSK